MKTVAMSKPRAGTSRPAQRPSRIAAVSGRIGRGVGGLARRRPGVVIAVLAVVAGGGAFSWNALTQTGRHPAPLFASRPDPASVEPPRRPEILGQLPPAPALAPPARPSEPAPASVRAEPPRAEPPRADPAPRREAAPPPRAPGAGAPSAGGDAIGALIRASDPSARINELARGGDQARPAPDPGRVASVQRALTKLGYGPLKADGIMGAGTRQAIERFEREKNLPVSGALPVRTVRQLAALSGVAVE